VSSTDYFCASGNHVGDGEVGQCFFQGLADEPYTITFGGWIDVQYCDVMPHKTQSKTVKKGLTIQH